MSIPWRTGSPNGRVRQVVLYMAEGTTMSRGLVVRAFHAFLLLWVAVGFFIGAPPAQAQRADPRLFPQTGYRVDDDAFWSYFQRRGGVRNFGYPVSGTFALLGFRVQLFQRAILQLQPNGSVSLMNVLDEGLLPYTTINGSTFPGSDPEVIRRQPAVGTPDYHVRALQFVEENAPDVWQGMKVDFFRTFSESVRAAEVFPDGRGDPALLPGFNLEIWGLPTSKPTADPANGGFVYQRFQRGIMHFDAATGTTQGLLLADYVKSILTNRNLPPDLATQARDNRLYAQFDPRADAAVRRPSDLPGSDLRGAFARLPSVFVDAGHGGKEIGSSYTFPDGVVVVEKELNLIVAARLAELLRAEGIEATVSRASDVQVNASKDLNGDGKVNLTDDLQARVDLANEARADLLFSVHFNGISDPSKRGSQMFYAEGRPFSERSRILADLAQGSLVKLLKEAGFETVDRKAAPDSRILGSDAHFYLLGASSEVIKRPTAMPGVIAEGLFVTNEEDARALRQPRIREAIARAYAEAIREYFRRYPVS